MARRRVQAFVRMAVTAFVAAFLFSCAKEQAPRNDSDVIVAEVDGAPITLKELKGEIASMRGVTAARETRSASSTEISRALRLLVERAVVLREGKALGVSVSDSDVEEEIRRYRSDLPPGGLEKSLLGEGIEMEAWRLALRRSILYRKSADAIAAARAAVSEEEVRRSFQERKREMSRPERILVRQLLFDNLETARDARDMLAGGTDPGEVVRRLSSGDSIPAAASLGFLTREDLPPEISDALFAMREGGVSEPIRQEKTYSLFVVEKREPARTLDFAAAAPEIREELLRARREAAFAEWLAAETGKADVRVREAILATVGREGK